MRDAEWSGRLFVIDMKEDSEEGIGVHIEVDHISPAFVGDIISFMASYEGVDEKGVVKTAFEAYVKGRLIAKGKQGQRVLRKDKIDLIFNQLNS